MSLFVNSGARGYKNRKNFMNEENSTGSIGERDQLGHSGNNDKNKETSPDGKRLKSELCKDYSKEIQNSIRLSASPSREFTSKEISKSSR